MKLSFDQVIRLILCVAGIIFFGVGIWMIKSGISAQGVIDIQMREVLSGRLETGSAGLFITFFSFCMIVLSLLIGRKPITSRPKDSPRLPSKMPVALTILVVLWSATTGFYFIARDTKSDNECLLFGLLSALFFIVSGLSSFGTFMCWLDEHEEKKQATNGRRDA